MDSTQSHKGQVVLALARIGDHRAVDRLIDLLPAGILLWPGKCKADYPQQAAGDRNPAVSHPGATGLGPLPFRAALKKSGPGQSDPARMATQKS